MTVGTTVTASAHVTVADVQAVTATSSLVMQAVIVPGSKTKEGQLIEAVTLPWFEVIKLLQADPNAAFQIPPRKWEEIYRRCVQEGGV
jgi:hypothetical protein